jgi:shikimate dehydrogenase
MPIGPQTRLAALIGDPVKHSLSPLIHNTAYRVQRVDAVYVAARVYAADLREAVAGLASLGALGVNVTLPHKETVLPLLDEVRSDARAIGAVNTIVFERGDDTVRIIGDNTDVTGFLAPLVDMKDSIRGRSVAILGAGGAARAVLFACQTSLRPALVTVVARNEGRARKMVKSLMAVSEDIDVEVLSFEGAEDRMADATLVVNTTPVGLYPEVRRTPWPAVESFRPGQIVYDLVYNPIVTRLLRDAGSRGAVTINGTEMLIGQAAAANTLWTGLRMPVEDVREAVLRALNKPH